MVDSFTPSQDPALNRIQLITLQMLIKFSSEIDTGFLFFFRGSSLDGWMKDGGLWIDGKRGPFQVIGQLT